MLLRDCLKQTYRVLQLSPAPEDHSEAKTLQAMARLALGDVPLRAAAEEAGRAPARLLSNVLEADCSVIVPDEQLN